MIGRTISHYKVIDKIGEGGMGSVWKAEDTSLGRLVALKTLSSHLAQNEEARERFIREAQAASSLNHPNITTVYELVEAEDAHLICMEHVEGKTVRDMLESGRVSIKKAIDVILQAAEALEAAHRKGILHRDIKSANIMVTLEGRVKVMDFGLAHLGERSQLTRTGTLLGTLAYTSPEQIAGKPYDARSEIWSLGVVLYELLAGRLPFQASNEAELIFGIINNEPPVLGEVREDSDMLVESVVARMLEKDPTLRYQSMGELTNDLAALRKGLETGTTSVIQALQQTRQLRRHQRIIRSGVTAVVILMLAGLVYVLPGLLTPTRPQQVAIAPFRNMTQDQSRENVSSRLAQGIIDGIREYNLVPVLDWDETRLKYQDLTHGRTDIDLVSPAKLARKCGATLVITGEYYDHPDGLEFRLRIHDIPGDHSFRVTDVSGPIDDTGLEERITDHIIGALASYLDPWFRFWAPGITPLPSYSAYQDFKTGFEISASLSATQNENPLPYFLHASQHEYYTPLLWALLSPGADRDSLLSILNGHRDQLTETERQMLQISQLTDERPDREQKYRICSDRAKAWPKSMWSRRAASAAFDIGRFRDAEDHFRSLESEIGLYQEAYDYVWFFCEVLWSQRKYKTALKVVQKVPLEEHPNIADQTILPLVEIISLLYLDRVQQAWKVLEETRQILSNHPDGDFLLGIYWRYFPPLLLLHDHPEELPARREEARQWFEGRSAEEKELTGYRCTVAHTLYYYREWERAAAILEDVVETAVSQGGLYYSSDQWGWNNNIGIMGGYPGIIGYLGCAAVRSGDERTAAWADSLLLDLEQTSGVNTRYQRARIAAVRGDIEGAIEHLAQAGDFEFTLLGLTPTEAHWFDFKEVMQTDSYKALLSSW